MVTLAEFDAEVTRLEGLSDVWEARESLRGLSATMRRMLWRDRAKARAIYDRADDIASRIEAETPDMMPTGREPRFPAVYQGGVWSPAVM